MNDVLIVNLWYNITIMLTAKMSRWLLWFMKNVALVQSGGNPSFWVGFLVIDWCVLFCLSILACSFYTFLSLWWVPVIIRSFYSCWTCSSSFIMSAVSSARCIIVPLRAAVCFIFHVVNCWCKCTRLYNLQWVYLVLHFMSFWYCLSVFTYVMVISLTCKVRGYAYEKIEYVKIRVYFSKNKIRV